MCSCKDAREANETVIGPLGRHDERRHGRWTDGPPGLLVPKKEEGAENDVAMRVDE